MKKYLTEKERIRERLEYQINKAKADAKEANYKLFLVRNELLRFDNEEFFNEVHKAIKNSSFSRSEVNRVLTLIREDLISFIHLRTINDDVFHQSPEEHEDLKI